MRQLTISIGCLFYFWTSKTLEVTQQKEKFQAKLGGPYNGGPYSGPYNRGPYNRGPYNRGP